MPSLPLQRWEYLRNVRHPWACLLFVLPILIAYELGVWLIGDDFDSPMRNGVDTWLQWLLRHIGLPHSFWPGVLLLGVLLGWCLCKRRDRPRDLLNVWIGILIESALYAIGLWAVCAAFGPYLGLFSPPLNMAANSDPAIRKLIGFLGAGIYEEAVFRLLLFSFLHRFLRLAELPQSAALAVAIVISSLAFAGAHHAGPSGDPFNGYVFLYRTIAGVYFALLYYCRGFGVAVGAHAGYDMLVGLLLGE